MVEFNFDHIIQDLHYIGEILETGDSIPVKNREIGFISVDKGNIGKSGNGLQHIIEQRFEKDGKSVDEISSVLALVVNATEMGKIIRNVEVIQDEKDIGTFDIEKNGIISFVSKTRDGKDEKFIITGFDDFSKREEAGDAIKAVIAENSYAPEFVIVKEQVVATLASSFILHLNEIKNNMEKNNLKKVNQEIVKLKNYEKSDELKKYFSVEKNQKKIEEARNSINAVIATYGNTPEFLGVYAQVGAVLSSYNYNIVQKEELSSNEEIKQKLTQLEQENSLLKAKIEEIESKNIEEAQGYVTKLENPSFENLKKILEANKHSQVIVDPSNKRRSPRDLNLQQIDEHVNNKNTQNISPAEYLLQKINASGINVHLSKEEMKAILEAGKDVQKLAVKYGTNQNLATDKENALSGYGTYVVSVNEENARQLGIKIASRRYGGTFYINNQPLRDFLQEKGFSPYWNKRLEQLGSNSVDSLSHEIIMADVKGNPTLEQEQNKISTLLGLGLVEYKREQTYLYSVDIPDNNSTNYLLYNNPIGIEQATRINAGLERLGVEWRVSRNDIGKNVYFDVLATKVFEGNQKAASEFLKENVGFVGMQMDGSNYIIFDDKDMSITDRVQYMKTENGEVYGFAFEGEIYVDEEVVNSNVLAHEYTHIWDKYVQKNNPELWQKGMTCLKGTSLWHEITEDKNYENLRTDDEILSECHAHIVGKMAEQVLERIAARDGELTKDKIIDWDKEVNEYVATDS